MSTCSLAVDELPVVHTQVDGMLGSFQLMEVSLHGCIGIINWTRRQGRTESHDNRTRVPLQFTSAY